MASTFSSLKIELIGTGEQDGTWSVTTNTNLGTTIEQAITGSGNVTFASADVTLTLVNSNAAQTARNLRLVCVGVSNGSRQLIVPAIEKQYIVKNELADPVTIRNGTGTGIAIPSGKTMVVFNDGTNVVDVTTYASALSIGDNLSVTGTVTAIGAISAGNASFSGTVTVPTAANTSNTTVAASTAFVKEAISVLGTIATQNANNVTITGGTITGITDLAVADGGTGRSTLTANAVLVGNGTSGINSVAPGTSGNLLVSNGSAWTSTTLAASGVKLGLGITGEVWNNVTGDRSSGTSYTNSRAYPIMVSATGSNANSGPNLRIYVNGILVSSFNWQFNGAGAQSGGCAIVPPGATYQLNFDGSGILNWVELY